MDHRGAATGDSSRESRSSLAAEPAEASSRTNTSRRKVSVTRAECHHRPSCPVAAAAQSSTPTSRAASTSHRSPSRWAGPSAAAAVEGPCVPRSIDAMTSGALIGSAGTVIARRRCVSTISSRAFHEATRSGAIVGSASPAAECRLVVVDKLLVNSASVSLAPQVGRKTDSSHRHQARPLRPAPRPTIRDRARCQSPYAPHLAKVRHGGAPYPRRRPIRPSAHRHWRPHDVTDHGRLTVSAWKVTRAPSSGPEPPKVESACW